MPLGIICGRITPARGNLEHRPLSGAVCMCVEMSNVDMLTVKLSTNMNVAFSLVPCSKQERELSNAIFEQYQQFDNVNIPYNVLTC